MYKQFKRGTACYPSSLKVLRKPHYTNEQTADPRRNQRRSSPCHSCIVSKISQVLKDKNEAQRFLQYHFTKH